MSKCIYCHQKRGKRPCPALGGEICTGCCGEHRGREITCPTNCPYFVTHEAYQRGRLGEVFSQAREGFHEEVEKLHGSRALQLLNLCDVAAYQFFHNRSGALDWELLAGLEYSRRQLSAIAVPSGGPTPYGEFLDKSVQEFCSHARIPSDLGCEVLDRLMRFLMDFSGADLRSNRYLKGLVGFMEQSHPTLAGRIRQESSHSNRIILPYESMETTHAKAGKENLHA